MRYIVRVVLGPGAGVPDPGEEAQGSEHPRVFDVQAASIRPREIDT